jgi:hypothetical protein
LKRGREDETTQEKVKEKEKGKATVNAVEADQDCA